MCNIQHLLYLIFGKENFIIFLIHLGDYLLKIG